jgi:hypothetical protein
VTDTHLPNSIDAPLVDPEFIANKHKAAFVLATTVLNAEAGLPLKVETEADLERLAKHVKDARSVHSTLDAARTSEKRRFDDAGREVQGLFTPRLTKLEASRKVAMDRINAHNQIVEERQRAAAKAAADAQRVEAERRAAAAAAIETSGMGDVAQTILDTAVDAQAAAEKLDRVATGSAADLVRTSTAAGTVSAATKLTFEVTDWPIVRKNLGTLGDYIDAATVEKAIRAHLKAEKLASRHPALPGVRFYEERSARVR